MKNIYKKLIQFFAFGFGSGLIPFVPGTMGTLAAIPLYLLIHSLSLTFYAILLILGFIIGIWICQEASKFSSLHDDPKIVWDEIIGFLLTMFAVPFSGLNIVIGFLAFRLFDIQKPWPIGWVDKKVKDGLGIMLDDILAAIYANLILRVFITFMQ